MWQFLLSGLRVGVRGRSFHAVFLLGFALIGVAYLSGSFSPRQPSTVALDVGLSGIRVTLVMLSLFWVQELLTLEIDRRIILFSFTYPVSRAEFVVGRLGAVILLVGMATIVFGLALTVAVILAGAGYAQGFPVSLGLPFWLTLTGFVLDVMVVAAVGFCVAAFSTVAMMPLVIGFAFAVAGKALGATLEYLNSGADGDAALISSLGGYMEAIRWLIPDLSRLDWREWPMYGAMPAIDEMAWATAMSLGYAAILTLLAIKILGRREFS